MNDKIFVTSPLLPSIEDFTEQVKEIYDSKWLTNMGSRHKALEEALKVELKVPHAQLFNNGTIALLTAIKALDLPYVARLLQLHLLLQQLLIVFLGMV